MQGEHGRARAVYAELTTNLAPKSVEGHLMHAAYERRAGNEEAAKQVCVCVYCVFACMYICMCVVGGVCVSECVSD